MEANAAVYGGDNSRWIRLRRTVRFRSTATAFFSREEGQVFDVALVTQGLERPIYCLSVS